MAGVPESDHPHARAPHTALRQMFGAGLRPLRSQLAGRLTQVGIAYRLRLGAEVVAHPRRGWRRRHRRVQPGQDLPWAARRFRRCSKSAGPCMWSAHPTRLRSRPG